MDKTTLIVDVLGVTVDEDNPKLHYWDDMFTKPLFKREYESTDAAFIAAMRIQDMDKRAIADYMHGKHPEFKEIDLDYTFVWEFDGEEMGDRAFAEILYIGEE
jgi:hypothetical protein